MCQARSVARTASSQYALRCSCQMQLRLRHQLIVEAADTLAVVWLRLLGGALLALAIPPG